MSVCDFEMRYFQVLFGTFYLLLRRGDSNTCMDAIMEFRMRAGALSRKKLGFCLECGC